MRILFIEYPKCSTCKKANLIWKKSHFFHRPSYCRRHPDRKRTRTMDQTERKRNQKFFNTSGMKYLGIGIKGKLPSMSEKESALLASDGMLIKRPLLIGENFVLSGFKEKEWTRLLRNNDNSSSVA